MRYLQAGSGRALILVHGLMGYSFSWRFTLPALAPYATCYAIDNLGAGLSTAPEGMDCSVRATAERILKFADAAGIALARAATPNADRRFARLAADLIDELRDGREPARMTGPDPVPGCLASISGEPCRPPHCAAR